MKFNVCEVVDTIEGRRQKVQVEYDTRNTSSSPGILA